MKEKKTRKQAPEDEISYIIGNKPLSSDIRRVITTALSCSFVHLASGKTVMEVFEHSLTAAIRDIDNHPRGELFQRLLKYGSPVPDDPELLISDGATTLSDPECGACIDFVYSYMVNRFKGELAELLALEPCIDLLASLKLRMHLRTDIQLYWGDTVAERRRITGQSRGRQWGSFAKGADGLIVSWISGQRHSSRKSALICAIIEVKSMPRSDRQVIDQIERHKARLSGGVKLENRELRPSHVSLNIQDDSNSQNTSMQYVIVFPSRWKLYRTWHSQVVDSRTRLIVSERHSKAPVDNTIEEVGKDRWKITLAWSQEALSEAAYHMTMWYMAQVGSRVFTDKSYLERMHYDDSADAGVDMVKTRLYEIQLRHISPAQMKRATRLYNAYCYGYQFTVDAKSEALWPDDFPEE